MSTPLVFVTGATGFIGAHVVAQTLEAGHHVRLSVRKVTQIDGLKKLFSKHAQNLDFIVIPDLSIPRPYKSALRDVTYVFHLASPMPGKGSDFKKDYLLPAQQGTTSLLVAALSVPTIKRIVVVSSVLSLLPLDSLTKASFEAKEGTNLDISIDPKMQFPEDPMASGGLKYHASKILAHRATLQWVTDNKPQYKVITLHPSFVFGRNLTQSSPSDIDGSNGLIYGSLQSEKPFIPLVAVDVRDVAIAHLRALELDMKNSDIEEFILSASKVDGWTWARLSKFVNERYPSVGTKLVNPSDDGPSTDTRKAERQLRMTWRKMEDTVSSFMDHQVELRSKT